MKKFVLAAIVAIFLVVPSVAAASVATEDGLTSTQGVLSYQRAHGLQTDGVLGHQTAQAALGNYGVATGPLTYADQQALGLASYSANSGSYSGNDSGSTSSQSESPSTSQSTQPSTSGSSSPSSSSSSSSGGYTIPSYIVRCESGGDYHAVNPSSGAGGAYQILPSTWHAYGGSGAPQDASPQEQGRIASRIYSQGGASQWSCSH